MPAPCNRCSVRHPYHWGCDEPRTLALVVTHVVTPKPVVTPPHIEIGRSNAEIWVGSRQVAWQRENRWRYNLKIGAYRAIKAGRAEAWPRKFSESDETGDKTHRTAAFTQGVSA